MPGDRVRDGDWYKDGEGMVQITKNSMFRWFVGQPVKKPGYIFPNRKRDQR